MKRSVLVAGWFQFVFFKLFSRSTWLERFVTSLSFSTLTSLSAGCPLWLPDYRSAVAPWPEECFLASHDSLGSTCPTPGKLLELSKGLGLWSFFATPLAKHHVLRLCGARFACSSDLSCCPSSWWVWSTDLQSPINIKQLHEQTFDSLHRVSSSSPVRSNRYGGANLRQEWPKIPRYDWSPDSGVWAGSAGISRARSMLEQESPKKAGKSGMSGPDRS